MSVVFAVVVSRTTTTLSKHAGDPIMDPPRARGTGAEPLKLQRLPLLRMQRCSHSPRGHKTVVVTCTPPRSRATSIHTRVFNHTREKTCTFGIYLQQQ